MLLTVALGQTTGCSSAASPTLAQLGGSPLLASFAGETVLTTFRVQPRRMKVGAPGRDGVIERVVALSTTPDATADEVQRRQPGLSRIAIGSASSASIELRGKLANGGRVVVGVRLGEPRPLYVALDALAAFPPSATTSVVVTLISPQ